MGSGTFTWKLVDDDGDLADDDSDPVTIYGIGRVGASTSVETVTGQSSSGSGSGSGPSDPQELRSFTSTSSTSDDKVLSDKWWA